MIRGSLQEDAAQPRVNARWENFWVPAVIVFGVILGGVLPLEAGDEPQVWRRVSSILGWTYFVAWTASFYPQVFMNWRRRSVLGLSVDYQLLNIVGFTCYFVFNASLLYSPLVREEYRERHDGNNSAVRLNDVVFAGHAVLITSVILIQIVTYYDYPALDRADRRLRFIVVLCICGTTVMAVVGAIVASASTHFTWLTYVGLLANVKLVITVFKYCPQVWMNYRRQSTDGWNIHNVLLDITGGALSVAQLLIDAWAKADWSAVTGDPVKLMLGNVSIVFDIIFMVQHYCLYAKNRDATPAAKLVEECVVDAAY